MLPNWLTAWFPASAPDVGAPTSSIAPENVANDPLGSARNGAYMREPVHAKTDGYLPSWKWKSPPGVGDAPQHVWTTWALIPFSVDGPGDKPATYLRSIQAPVVVNFAMRQQGMAVDGGNMLLTGLYTPQPMGSMNSSVYGPQ